MAFKEAAASVACAARACLAVRVVTPEDYAGAIMGDLSSRRGRMKA